MISNFTKVININANSLIDNVVVVTMWASVNEDKTVNLGKSVRDTEAYFANQEICDADYAEFEAEVLKIAQV